MSEPSSNELVVSVYTPERRLLEGVRVRSIRLPTAEGEIEILPGHASIVGALESGVMSYETSGGERESAFVTSGFFKVIERDGRSDVTLLAEVLELKGEIDLSRAKRAQQKAEKTLQEAELDPAAFRKYQLKLERALIRQQFGGNA